MSKLLKRVLVLTTLIITGQLLIHQRYSFDEFKLINRMLHDKTDIILLGDSVNRHTAKADTDKRPISKMLDDLVPEKVGGLSHGAYGMRVFLEYSRYIVKQPDRPKLVIIAINMMSFSPEWLRRPEYQFEKEKFILKHELMGAFYRPLAVFKYNFQDFTQEDFEATLVYDCDKRLLGTYKELSDGSIRNQIVLNYMYCLSPDNEEVKAMREITRLLSENHIDHLFYITPVDYETCEKYFPGEFTNKLKANIGTIKSLLEKDEVVDLSMALGPDVYDYQDGPNSHVNEIGRRFIAEQLARHLSYGPLPERERKTK